MRLRGSGFTSLRERGLLPHHQGEVLHVLGNPKSEEVHVKVLGCGHSLPKLQTAAKDQGACEDYAEGLQDFDQGGNSAILGAEIQHVLVTLGEKMTEEERRRWWRP
uniref:Uncharacterized protein n=1 Tax=Callithrix jacchus TaxID=9483 RepID=A0A5F4W1S4_CALJA